MANWGMAQRATGLILVAGLMGLLIMPQVAQAGSRLAGAKVGLTTAQRSVPFTGEIIGVRADAIVLETEQREAETVAIKDIITIRVYHGSRIIPGIVLGSLAGGGLGYGLSSGAYKDKFLGGIAIAMYTGLGLALGGLVGGVSGGAMGTGKTYDLTKMEAAEIDKLMTRLRKNARIPNYK